MLSHFCESTVIQWITFVCTCFQKDYIVCLLFHDDTVWSYLQANWVLPLINCSDVGCHQPKRIQMLGEQMTQYYLFILIFHHMIHDTYIMIPFRSWVLECAFLVFCKDVWWFSLQDKPSPAPTKEQRQWGGFPPWVGRHVGVGGELYANDDFSDSAMSETRRRRWVTLNPTAQRWLDQRWQCL